MALEFQRSISRKSLIASTVSQMFMINHPLDWEWDYISPLRSSNGMAASSGWKATKTKGPHFSFPCQSFNSSSAPHNTVRDQPSRVLLTRISLLVTACLCDWYSVPRTPGDHCGCDGA